MRRVPYALSLISITALYFFTYEVGDYPDYLVRQERVIGLLGAGYSNLINISTALVALTGVICSWVVFFLAASLSKVSNKKLLHLKLMLLFPGVFYFFSTITDEFIYGLCSLLLFINGSILVLIPSAILLSLYDRSGLLLLILFFAVFTFAKQCKAKGVNFSIGMFTAVALVYLCDLNYSDLEFTKLEWLVGNQFINILHGLDELQGLSYTDHLLRVFGALSSLMPYSPAGAASYFLIFAASIPIILLLTQPRKLLRLFTMEQVAISVILVVVLMALLFPNHSHPKYYIFSMPFVLILLLRSLTVLKLPIRGFMVIVLPIAVASQIIVGFV